MKKYYLYRSEERDGEYIKISEFTPTDSSSPFILEDNTVDWIGNVYTTYYYKVAAVLENDTEMMSISGMRIYLFSPTTYMRRSIVSSLTGYCGLKLAQPDSDKIWEWEVESSEPNKTYELKLSGTSGIFYGSTGVSAGNYNLYTAKSKNSWSSPSKITLKRAHKTTIYILENGVSSEFDKSCWSSY
jgi:hypothetical protein